VEEPKARRHNLIVLGSSPHDARLAREREGTLAHVGLATTLPNPE
jgi:hypothetical protein